MVLGSNYPVTGGRDTGSVADFPAVSPMFIKEPITRWASSLAEYEWL